MGCRQSAAQRSRPWGHSACLPAASLRQLDVRADRHCAPRWQLRRASAIRVHRPTPAAGPALVVSAGRRTGRRRRRLLGPDGTAIARKLTPRVRAERPSVSAARTVPRARPRRTPRAAHPLPAPSAAPRPRAACACGSTRPARAPRSPSTRFPSRSPPAPSGGR